MESYFDKFYENIKLTSKQKEDAKTKYTGVIEKLHNYYYDNKYDGKTKLLIGSYGKKTNIRPARDIDVIFKMPEEYFEQYDNHESNGQANLLNKIKSILEEKYSSSSIKVSEKVVIVEFSDLTHNIEVLPSFEQSDKTFKIPNTVNGGSWEVWDPRTEIKKIEDSDSSNSGNTRKLIRMFKKWSEKCSIKLKSYKIEEATLIFLDDNNYIFSDTQTMIYDFFCFFESEIEGTQKSHVITAKKRSKKAIDYYKNNQELKAIEEWRKIFGKDFPSQKTVKSALKENRYYSSSEQFIEDFNKVNFDNDYFVELNCYVTQDGWPTKLLKKMSFLRKQKQLEFFIESTNVPKPFSVKWKVRNFGEEALNHHDLRGQIYVDAGKHKKRERTKYYGTHYVECYIIKDNICVAYNYITVPIKAGEENG